MKRSTKDGRISETQLAHWPMPANAMVLYLRALKASEAFVGLAQVKRPRDLKWARRAWATMALATAISCKHASAALRRNRRHAAMIRIHYAHLAESADAFGETLAPVWPGERTEAA